MQPSVLLRAAALAAILAPLAALETVLEDFAHPDGLVLGGQRLQPESALRFAAGPSGHQEAELRFSVVALADGIPTVGIRFPPHSRSIRRPARRLLVELRGDRAGLPLRATLLDRSGELHMYQLEPTAAQGPGGSVIYAADLGRAGFFTWGGDGNKHPDYPLDLDQLFLDGNGSHGASGTVFIAAISMDADHDNRAPTIGRPQLIEDFAKPGTVRLGGDQLDPASRLTVAPLPPLAAAAQLHFRFEPGSKSSCGFRFAPAPVLAGPLHELRFLVHGDAARLAIRANLLDAHDELHMYTCVPAAGDDAPPGCRWIAVDFARPPLFTAGGDGDHVLQWPARLDLLFIDGNGNQGAEGDLALARVVALPDGDAAGPATAPVAVQPELLDRCERVVADAGTWGDKAQPAASLALDRTAPFEGAACLRLDYRFAAVDTGQACFAPVGRRLPAGTARIRVAARSEGADRQIHATLIGAGGAYTTVTLGVAPAGRWQVLDADLAGRGLAWPVTWRDVVVARDPGRPDQGRVWIDAIGADLPDPPSGHLTPSLDLGRWPPLCWGADDAPRGALVVAGGATADASLPLSYRLLDHRGRDLGESWSGQATARVGTPFRHELRLHLPGYGVYELAVSLGDRSSRHSFAWLPQRSPQWAEGPFGVNATPRWLLDAMAGIGMAWNRAEYGWRLVEHRPGVFEDAAFAGPQAAVAAAGMRSLLLIGDWGPQQCLGAGRAPDTPALDQAYGRYCAWMATANPGPLTRHFQIWNEPNLAGFWWPKPDVGHYTAALRASYAAIKAADPAAQVVGVNMSCVDLPFLDAVLAAGGGTAMDVLALHPYHLPEAPERAKRAVPSPTLGGEFPPGTFLEQMGRLTDLLRRHDAGRLKIWLDEFGYPDRPDLYPEFAHPEWESAALVVRQSLLALTMPQVERLFAYNARDTATGDPGNWDNATGFVRSDGSPKARFASWATMTRMLDHRRFVRRLAIGDDAFACEFTGTGAPVLALWCVTGARTVAFAGSGDAPSLTDSMGNTLALVPRAGRVVIGIGEEPVWLAGWRDAAPAEAPLAAPSGLRCAPGERVEVAAPEPGRWELDAPAGWSVSRLAPDRFSLAPGAEAITGAVPLRLVGPGATVATTLRYGDSLRIRVRPGRSGAEAVIDNPYATARSLVLNVTPAGGPATGIAAVAAPRAVTTVAIPAACAGSDGQVTVPLTVAAGLASGQPSTPVVIEAGRQTVAGWTPCPALVGGALAGPPCRLDRPHELVTLKPGGPWNPADLSGGFRIGWDAQHLHLEVLMHDDVHRPQADRTRLWQGDSLQFDLSVAGVRHEFDIAIPASGPALTWRRAPAEGPADGLVASGSRDGAITSYVVDLPWHLVAVDDPLRADLRFALLVNDDDGPGRRGWIEWCEGIGMAKDAERFGPLVLAR